MAKTGEDQVRATHRRLKGVKETSSNLDPEEHGRRSGLLPFLNPDEHSGCDRNSSELLARPLTPMHPHKLPWLSRR
jgi:hypothetical protein